MNDDVSVINILIFAAIAIVLLFRLRAVLGRRTGEEQERPNPLDRPPMVPMRRGMADQPRADGRAPVIIDNDPTMPLSLEARLSRVRAAEPSFEERHFLTGAKQAFQMVVQAFAAGDLATLRPLLSSNLYGEFGRAISGRPRGEIVKPIRFHGPIDAEIVDAKVVDREVQSRCGSPAVSCTETKRNRPRTRRSTSGRSPARPAAATRTGSWSRPQPGTDRWPGRDVSRPRPNGRSGAAWFAMSGRSTAPRNGAPSLFPSLKPHPRRPLRMSQSPSGGSHPGQARSIAALWPV